MFASLAAPAAPSLFQRPAPTPFGLPRELLAGSLIIALLLVARRIWKRSANRTRGILRVAVWLIMLAVAALAFNAIVALRSTGFYTADVLMDAMTALLGVHALSSVLRWIGAPRDTPSARDHSDPASHDLRSRRRHLRAAARPHLPTTIDRMDVVAAVLLSGFWIFAALGARELAGVLLLGVGGIITMTVFLGFDLAWTSADMSKPLRARRFSWRRYHPPGVDPGQA